VSEKTTGQIFRVVENTTLFKFGGDFFTESMIVKVTEINKEEAVLASGLHGKARQRTRYCAQINNLPAR
jgi:hypothetical protein